MKKWIGSVARLVAAAEGRLDERRYAAPDHRPARVAPYVGYGTRTHLTVLGRVLRGAALGPSPEQAGSWENLLATLRRFEPDEVPFACVAVDAGDTRRELTANGEGHFLERITLERPLPAGAEWHDVTYTVTRPAAAGPARGRVLVPSPRAAFGVISDIDDTVVRTDATQLLRMARTLLFGNARTRLPFAGVAAFYQALAVGGVDGGPNPLFYVSSGPWNLYDLLVEFFELQRIPMGPLLLRDWGIEAHELLPTNHGAHKQLAIRRVLAEYPALRFLLIGDSGQEDPEIYASVVRDHPGRILAVYIRDVTGSAERSARIARLAEEVARAPVELLLVPDTLAAATHAASRGWIAGAALESIAAGAAVDSGPG